MAISRREGCCVAEPDTGTESNIDAIFSDCESDSSNTDIESDSEAEELRQSIEFHAAQGRARSRRDPWSDRLINREFQHWTDFCGKISSREKIRRDPVETLRLCEAALFKAYLEWRVQKNRIKKESTIQAYWRRMLCKYIDVAGHSMNDGTELDIRDWIPTYLTPEYNLDTSEKEKHAMFVEDLYVMVRAQWSLDAKAMHGRIRVEESFVFILCAATATRPGAVLVRGTAKDSKKKVFSYKHIQIMRVRDAKNLERTTTVALVSLVHIKNSGGTGRRKRFCFRLESILAFCLVSHIISLALADNAFRIPFKSPQEIFDLEIPAGKPSLKVKFRDDYLNRPFLQDVEILGRGEVLETRALPYHKARAQLVSLGRLIGLEHIMEFYHIRRASGRKLNSAIPPEERNQTMGHRGGTYEQFYLPDFIGHDFQSIYFGTPAEEELIQRVTQIGISRDEGAPIRLTDVQKLEVKSNPQLVRLMERRDCYRQQIQTKGFRPISKAMGTELYDKYEYTVRKIDSLRQTLNHNRLVQAIQEYHDGIDTYYIERQRAGFAVPEVARPSVEFQFPERAKIAKLLSQPLNELDEPSAMQLRIQFIDNLYRYCFREESRRSIARCKTIYTRFTAKDERDRSATKRKSSDGNNTRSQKRQRPPQSEPNSASSSPASERLLSSGEGEHISERRPMKFTNLVCLICMGAFATRDTLRKHVECHVNAGKFKCRFQCQDPYCSVWIEGLVHFQNHSAHVHGVRHAVRRC